VTLRGNKKGPNMDRNIGIRLAVWVLLSVMAACGHADCGGRAARHWTAPTRIADWGPGYLNRLALVVDGKGRGTVVACGQPTGEGPNQELHAYQFGADATAAVRDTVLRSGPLEVDDLVLRVNDSGQGLVTWSEISGIPVLASRLDGKTGTFGKVATLCCNVNRQEEDEEERAFRPNQVVLPDGSALVIWEDDDKLVSMRSEGADGHWTKPKAFSDRHCGFMGCDEAPVLAVDRLGNVTLAWTGALLEADAEAKGVDIVATRFDTKRGWTPGVRIVRRTRPQEEEEPMDLSRPRLLSLATGAHGEVLLTWSERDVYAAYGSQMGGEWSKARLVSEEGVAFIPKAAIDARGKAVVVWGDVGGGKLRAAFARNPGDEWSKTKVIESDESSEAIVPGLAGMANGDVLLAWQHSGKAWLTTYAAPMPAGTTVPLGSTPEAKSNHPLIATNEAGDVVVVWEEMRGDRRELWMSRTVQSGQGEK